MPSDPILDATLATSTAAGLPEINVAPNQGKMLMLMTQVQQAHTILEIGTLGGYSTIWLARGLPTHVSALSDPLHNAPVVTLELSPKHAEIARANIAHAGFGHLVDVRVGHAMETLAALGEEISAGTRKPFDLIFIDADKGGYPDYFNWSLKLSRPGTLIIADNVVRQGAVGDPNSTDPNVIGVRRMNALIAAEARVTATVIQTVGSKGYDGFALIRVN
jgi:predicted O-methyltransferase YrrM